MKLLVNKIIITTVLLTCVNNAYANSEHQKKGGKHQRPAFSSIDTNQDNQIDLEEFSQLKRPADNYEKVFSIIDSNDNDLIDEDEYNARKRNKNNKKRKARPTFTSIDINQDSTIDLDEFSQLNIRFGDHQTIFSAIDSDDNDLINEDEFLAHKPPHKNKRKGKNND